MFALLSNPWVAVFLATLGASVATVFVKWVSRENLKVPAFSKEDCAQGPDLAVAGIAALIVSLPSISKKASATAGSDGETLVTTLFIAIFIFGGLWAISTLIRTVGWKSATELRWTPGFLIPLAYGIISVAFCAWWIASHS